MGRLRQHNVNLLRTIRRHCSNLSSNKGDVARLNFNKECIYCSSEQARMCRNPEKRV